MPSNAPSPNATLGQLCRWVLHYALRRWFPLLAVIATMLLKVGMDVLKPWPMLFLVDHILQGKVMPTQLQRLVNALPGSQAPEALIGWTVGVTVVIFLLSWALGLARDYAGITLGQRMVYDLAADLFAKLQQLSMRFHTSSSIGDNIRRVTSDCSSVATILRSVMLPAVSAAVTLLAMFAVMWHVNATLTLFALAVVPWMVWVFRSHAHLLLDMSYRQQDVESKIYSIVEQTFSALPAVQAFGREHLNDERFARSTSDTLAATLSLTHVQLRFKVLVGLATATGTAAMLWFGARGALDGTMTVGTILLFLSYLASLYAPLESVMYSTSTFQGAAGSARRVLEVLATEVEIRDKRGAAVLSGVRGRVRFENVSFGYQSGYPILRNISLEACLGESVALVGPTGGGKTTLVSLIPRFFDPWQGRVLVDERDIRDVSVKSLRQHVSIVLQEPFLFPLSVAGNIAYGRPQATMAEIEAAARAARAHEFIVQLPEGYSTVVGERGATLSVGQRQRLAVARALLKDAPILILDEPTSALDAETEQSLMEALAKLMTNRTTFIIAHRLSTVRCASRILFLRDGVIVESGTHEELLARGGCYSDFHRVQFGDSTGLSKRGSA